jgi:hypothetical protein
MFMSLGKRASCWALSICLVSLSASVLRADVVSGGTASFSETLPFSTTLTGFSQYSGVLPLASIEFLFVTNLTGTATVTDGPGNPTQDVTLDFSSVLNVSNPSDTTVLVTARPAASAPITVPGDGSTNTYDVSGTSLTDSAFLTDPTLFAPFEGTGTFSLPITGASAVGFTPDLLIPFSVNGTATVNGTLEVLYTPVPEPSTASAVLLGGLVVAAACLLRRRLGGSPAFLG